MVPSSGNPYLPFYWLPIGTSIGRSESDSPSAVSASTSTPKHGRQSPHSRAPRAHLGPQLHGQSAADHSHLSVQGGPLYATTDCVVHLITGKAHTGDPLALLDGDARTQSWKDRDHGILIAPVALEQFDGELKKLPAQQPRNA